MEELVVLAAVLFLILLGKPSSSAGRFIYVLRVSVVGSCCCQALPESWDAEWGRSLALSLALCAGNRLGTDWTKNEMCFTQQALSGCGGPWGQKDGRGGDGQGLSVQGGVWPQCSRGVWVWRWVALGDEDGAHLLPRVLEAG